MKPAVKIEVCEEPEIQYEASPELFEEIRIWLKMRGAVARGGESDTAVYYDTKNNRLLREGIEYRVKGKPTGYRHDMKTPLDTKQRQVMPDANDILWRNELKFKTTSAPPSLKLFFGQSLLAPVQERVTRPGRSFFDKELLPKFRSCFLKEKADCLSGEHNAFGRVEYSLQSGFLETMDGRRRTKPLYIFELELREGSMEFLLEEKAAVEEKFGPRGLTLLRDRKVMLGFGLLKPEMNEKQRRNLDDVLDRNHRAAIARQADSMTEKQLPVF